MTDPAHGSHVVLRLEHEGGELFKLHVGDLFHLKLTYDSDDERWSLWTLASGHVQMEGDRRNGEPMPLCALVEALGHHDTTEPRNT